jgi:hypothetical protein
LLAQGIAAEIKALTGKDVYLVMAKFERSFIDAKRPPELAVRNSPWSLARAPTASRRQSPGARQQRSVARSAQHAEQIPVRLVELLLVRDASIGIPRR